MPEQDNIMLGIGAPIWRVFCNVRGAEELSESRFLSSCKQCDLPVGHCNIQRLELPCAGLLQAEHWCWPDRKPGNSFLCIIYDRLGTSKVQPGKTCFFITSLKPL